MKAATPSRVAAVKVMCSARRSSVLKPDPKLYADVDRLWKLEIESRMLESDYPSNKHMIALSFGLAERFSTEFS